MHLVKATKASPHAKFDSLSTEYTVQYLVCWPWVALLDSILRIRIAVKCVLIFGRE